VGTRRFILQNGEDFTGGDLKGVGVDSIGRVQSGFNLGSVPITDASSIWSALLLKDGSLLLGTGNEGKLIQVHGAQAKVVAETKALVITSLAEASDGSVVLGTLPEGKVLKWASGKLTEWVKLKGVEHVWQVAFDPKTKAVFAATGPEGKLFRIDANGNAQVFFDAEEQHLMCVAVAPDGTIYAGASDKAKLYRITGPGRASVMHDFGLTEVRAVAVGPRGEVYAIANDIKASSDVPKHSSRSRAQASAGPVSPPSKTKGKGKLYRFDKDGSPEELLDNKEEHFVSLAVGSDGKPYVGTGVEGRVYTVQPNHNSVLIADTEERQVSALLLTGNNRFLASTDPAVLHPIRSIGGADAVWTSKVLDAGLRARFGRISWEASGSLELSTRTGGTLVPDETWSDWSRPITAPDLVESPPARYLQIRARWTRDPNATLNELEVPFVTDNLRAVIKEIDATSSARKAESSKDVMEASGGPIVEKPNADVKLKWKVDNPDKDELRFRLQYRMVGADTWFDMLKPQETLTKEEYTWDTGDLPEGRYRVRVVATDERANPPDRVKRHELESGIILVDNTPPTIEGLRATGRRVQGTVIDGVGPIARIEMSVAGSDQWRPYYPKDGIFDEQREEFDADVSSQVPAGPVMLSVRAYDQANNAVVRNLILK
jgi:hypothetical protein